jgi:signal transduction histidine kinase
MRPLVLFLVQLPPAIGAVVREGALRAFGQVEFVETDSVAEAAGFPRNDGPEVLVLANPDPAWAAEATDDGHDFRWAVVILGTEAAGDDGIVPPADWQPRLLAHVFRGALREHELARENARLRGDLRTVAHRISHDLRTPINCVHTTCELLVELAVGAGDGAFPAVQVIKESTAEISRLVERMSFLLKATIEPGLPGPVAMGPVVDAVLKKFAPRLRAAGTSVAQPDSWPRVLGVASWLDVIWCELLTNALVHGGTPPRIVAGWQQDENGDCRCWLTDHGPGMPPERAVHPFHSFDRLHASTFSGGLGLPIAQRLVALQRGRLGCENRPEGGARFWFTLPAAEAMHDDP